MDDYFRMRSRVPASGSWDYSGTELPFTECFETARQAGLLRYSYDPVVEDLYFGRDLYQNDVVTPTVFVLPRRRSRTKAAAREVDLKDEKKVGSWVVTDAKEPPSPPPPIALTPPPKRVPKPVDEDLYKISPALLRARSKKKRGLGVGFFSSCFRPICYCVKLKSEAEVSHKI